MKSMTHNEYKEYLKANASKLYNSNEYTMDDYMRDAESIKVIDYDLSKYQLPKNMQTIINKIFTTNEIDKNENELFRGSYDLDNVYSLATSLECEIGYDGGYSGFYYNLQNKMVLDYAEGDVTLTICENEEDYIKCFQDTVEFYNKCYVADIHYATFYNNSLKTEILEIYVGEREQIHQKFCELAKEYPAIVYDTNLTAKEYENPNNDEIDEEEPEI